MKVEDAERELLDLARVLDKPFAPRGDPDSVAMSLGHRARTLYRGYLTCSAAKLPPAAGRALLRPAVEVNILLRYIREDPEWRTRFWHAESTRMWMGLAEQAHTRPLPPQQKLDHLPTLEEIADVRKNLAELREGASAAGVAIPPKRFLPDVQEQVQSLDTMEAWQAYIAAYMPLTHEQHVAHGSFADAREFMLDDGQVVHKESVLEEPRYAERLLASSVFASTLVVVSSWVDLGVEAAADAIRAELVRLPEDS